MKILIFNLFLFSSIGQAGELERAQIRSRGFTAFVEQREAMDKKRLKQAAHEKEKRVERERRYERDRRQFQRPSWTMDERVKLAFLRRQELRDQQDRQIKEIYAARQKKNRREIERIETPMKKREYNLESPP